VRSETIQALTDPHLGELFFRHAIRQVVDCGVRVGVRNVEAIEGRFSPRLLMHLSHGLGRPDGTIRRRGFRVAHTNYQECVTGHAPRIVEETQGKQLSILRRTAGGLLSGEYTHLVANVFVCADESIPVESRSYGIEDPLSFNSM